ncbi:pectate lyase [Fusarium circinatum]|uniref:Pectate lyase n=1 Tax=Fusarium circinatum TaxID=48490 RepID=A0A8H5U632_FUSCI|nr:pectate lyase [Fusarium circinatum]
MRQTTLLTIANFGSAFTALLFYNQCSHGAYHGDTKCPLCPACAEASKWYSQYTPDAKAASVDTPDAGSGSGSKAEGITRTIPASNGSSAAATTIPVSGEFDGRYEVAEADLNRVEALLLQVAILRTYSLQNRVRTHTGVNGWLFETPDRDLPHMICTATHQELQISSGSEEQQGRGLVDFVEGRIFLHTLKSTTDHARSLLESFTLGVFYM